ncbi:MAG: 50S ribosomal protein L3 [Firmicutes bacterium]|nr:50S ribosomal protein L3 [Bacillota bacterium]
MPKGILGTKVGMTQVFDEKGSLVPVTVIEAGPCVVVQKKTLANEGYTALQLGFGEQKERTLRRPQKGHLRKAGARPVKYLREVRLDEGDDTWVSLEPGQDVRADIFAGGDQVDICGISLGKGFAGVVKRWGFRRGPMSHGSMYHRRTGSLGATDPARVFKGRKMPGRAGGRRTTVQGLTVVKVDAERNLLLVRGSVPGPRGGLVMVKETSRGRAGSVKRARSQAVES